ncbi:lactate utilization protein C [Streptomyces sp. NBC_00250]|uniref:LutC/YkgG family protein n=1 Tax=Streptomyces sp. NBC_00250 TaxID=2903641 RepID=UPI002E2BBF15|nr:lactate utilization protein C [Streptomyces sp. NBC_00250]
MTTPPAPSSRERILSRVRTALAEAPDTPSAPRGYLTTHTPDDPATVLDLLHENLADYRAHVHRAMERELPALIGGLLEDHGAVSVAVPPGLPAAWLSGTPVEQRHTPLTPYELDATDAVVTGCALAIAETGTIVLDGGPGQGPRSLTLVPDLHICVVRAADQIVASVPQAMPLLDPTRPLTWISGPSATSDIELDRVEGVHGPRTLHVVLLTTR